MASRPVPQMRTPYATRSYIATYRAEGANYCPGCGQSHWIVGRISAECARCATALPLAESVHSFDSASVVVATDRRPHLHAI